MAATPVNTPTSYNFITLDGQRTPGVCERTSGGERAYKVDNVQAPAFGGAYTIFRYKELSSITYSFRVWLDPSRMGTFDAEYAALQAFLESLNKGNDKRPPKTYRFLDLYLSHNAITSVIATSVGPIKQTKGKQEWSADVVFGEWKKLKIFGGVPKGPETSPDKALADAQAASANANKAFDDAVNTFVTKAPEAQGRGGLFGGGGLF